MAKNVPTLNAIFSKTVDRTEFLIGLLCAVFMPLQISKDSTLNAKGKFFAYTPFKHTIMQN